LKTKFRTEEKIKMSYRKRKESFYDKKRWKSFIEENKEWFQNVGLPLSISEDEEYWVDFLMHGYLDHHENPLRFNVKQLNEKQYSILKELVFKYFSAGFSYFTPIALSSLDQNEIRRNFAKETQY
jgi:hypothetical protein